MTLPCNCEIILLDITCPANITQVNDADACSASVVFAASPTDNCGVASTVYKIGATEVTSPHVFAVGVTTVDVTVTDIHGRTATCSFTVTVTDTEPPAIACPAPIAVNNDPGLCSAGLTIPTPGATDNCGSATVSGVRSDGKLLSEPYPVGVTTITWTAVDSHGVGNSVACTQTVTVTDNEALGGRGLRPRAAGHLPGGAGRGGPRRGPARGARGRRRPHGAGAFDVYMRCREKLFEIRVREIREARSVAARVGA